jgi:PAS domain S-box-containing protein
MPLAYCTLDSNGKIRSVNPYAARILGRSQEDLLGLSFFELSDDSADKLTTRQTITWKVSDIYDYAEQDIKIYHSHTQVIWIRLVLQPIYDAYQRIEGFHAYCFDITASKSHEIELQRSIDHLKDQIAERTQSLDQAHQSLKQHDQRYSDFFRDIAHEIRNPLATIGLRLHLMERTFPQGIEDHLDILKKQLLHVLKLVEGISHFVEVNQHQPGENRTTVNVVSVIKDVMAAHRPRAEAKNIHLKSAFPYEYLPVVGDATQLTQVFANLLTNALNYTASGEVTVKGEVDLQNRQVEIAVCDTGMGIPGEELPHIFDRFYRGRNVMEANIPGTGLGLGIVQEIIRSHDGRINVQSREGEGTTFTIILPCHPIDTRTS